MDDQVSAPLPGAIILLALARGVPAEEVAAPAIGGSFSGVIGASVEGVILRRLPGALQRAAHPVVGHVALGEGGVEQVPPVADPEEVGAFVGIVQSRRPERLADLPRLKISRRAERDAAPPAGGAMGEAGGEQHPVLARLLVPEDVGIAPVVRLIAISRRVKGVLRDLAPVQQVVADRVHHRLLRFSLGTEVGVVAGIEDMELPLGIDQRSR